MTTPAKQELRDLIAAKLAEHSSLFNDYPITGELADAVVGLFYAVDDEWDAIDVSTMADGPGGRLLDQRWLVARIPREARHRDMTADRTVSP